MVSQYPHFLFVRQQGDSVQDGNGNWTGQTGSWVLHSICREQTNGKGAVTNGGDGRAVVYESVVHLPVEAEPIAEGCDVKVSYYEDGSWVLIEGRVLKFKKGQLHSRLWV